MIAEAWEFFEITYGFILIAEFTGEKELVLWLTNLFRNRIGPQVDSNQTDYLNEDGTTFGDNESSVAKSSTSRNDLLILFILVIFFGAIY
jgi:hypothetical protein